MWFVVSGMGWGGFAGPNGGGQGEDGLGCTVRNGSDSRGIRWEPQLWQSLFPEKALSPGISGVIWDQQNPPVMRNTCMPPSLP